MTTRPLDKPTARLLNHVEFAYAPGERSLVRQLFEALGFRVLDPQTDPTPEALGPAAGPFLIVYLDSEAEDLIDNVVYASEVSEVQWRFESKLRDYLASDTSLAESHAELRATYTERPQAMTHIGVGYASADQVHAALERLRSAPDLAKRIQLTKVFMPGDPGAVDDRVIQAFVYTDLIAAGLLCGGQQIELQVRIDGV
ncbi:MAG: hypothetical protein GY910_02060 [bacterium]|nr:hypothetical protein [Deltaproteobacteria bacterium]MCP4903738.1 hypothetical protein [bacterium]